MSTRILWAGVGVIALAAGATLERLYRDGGADAPQAADLTGEVLHDPRIGRLEEVVIYHTEASLLADPSADDASRAIRAIELASLKYKRERGEPAPNTTVLIQQGYLDALPAPDRFELVYDPISGRALAVEFTMLRVTPRTILKEDYERSLMLDAIRLALARSHAEFGVWPERLEHATPSRLLAQLASIDGAPQLRYSPSSGKVALVTDHDARMDLSKPGAIAELRIRRQLDPSIQRFREAFGRYPHSLRELVDRGIVESLPEAPPGAVMSYSKATGEVRLNTVGAGSASS